MTVYGLLDLSTGHLPEDLGQDLTGHAGVVAYDLPYGWLLAVPPDLDDHIAEYAGTPDAVPDPIVGIWRLAGRHGCRYVLLDQDGPVEPELPTYDW